MPKAVSAKEAKNRLGSLIGWVREHSDEVIVENRGEPAAVIMSFAEYEKLQALRERQRRQAILERMRALQARVSARNADLSTAEAEALADEVTREAVAGLVERGNIRFEG